MTVKQRIQDDMKAAMRARDKDRLAVIRLMMAAIKQREVDERVTLDDSQTLSVLDRMLKQRRESIKQYTEAGRTDLAAREAFEVEAIQSYMPRPLSDDELDRLVGEAITTTHAQSVRDMGKVMAWLKPKVQGRADMAAVSGRIKARLSV